MSGREWITMIQVQGTIAASSRTGTSREVEIPVGGTLLTISLRTKRRDPADLPERGYGMIMQLAPDEFLVAGGNLRPSFAANSPGLAMVSLATVEEGEFADGKWQPGRTLKGDEIMLSFQMAGLAGRKQTGTGLRFRESAPTIQRARCYRCE